MKKAIIDKLIEIEKSNGATVLYVFAKELKSLIPQYFSARAMMHHHVLRRNAGSAKSMAEGECR